MNMKNKFKYTTVWFSLIIICVFVSCKEKETIKENDYNTNNNTGNQRTTKQNYTTDIDYKTRINNESAELKTKLTLLKEKVKVESGQTRKDIEQSIDKMEKDISDFDMNKTEDQLKDNWEKFKMKTNNTIDSLDKKIKQ
jgi:hypothetical protein